MADGNNAIVSPIADVFFSPGAPDDPDDAYQQCQAVDITDLHNQFPLFMGAPWLCGQHIFTHVAGPEYAVVRVLHRRSARSCRRAAGIPAASTCCGRRLGPVRQGLDQPARPGGPSGTVAGGEVISADSY